MRKEKTYPLRNILYLACILSLICHTGNASAQTEEPEDICITLDNCMAILDKAYTLDGSSQPLFLSGFISQLTSSRYADTIDYIPVEYNRRSYMIDRNPIMWIYESRNGLCNMLKFKTPNKDCIKKICNEFRELGPTYTAENGIIKYYAELEYHGKLYQCELSVEGDSILKIRDKGEIDKYIKHEDSVRRKKVDNAKNSAKARLYEGKFEEAITTLTGVRTCHPPLTAGIDSMIMDIRKNQIRDMYTRASIAVNEHHNLSAGIACCDSILAIDPQNDSIIQLKSLLRKERDGETPTYKDFDPNTYHQIIRDIEKIINTTIAESQSNQKQQLSLVLNIQTTDTNQTDGRLSYNVNESTKLNRKQRRYIETKNIGLSAQLDSIIRNSRIKPIYHYGVNVNTFSKVSSDIVWTRYIEKYTNNSMMTAGDSIIKRFADQVVEHYFVDSTYSPKTGAMEKKVKRPYREEYTFEFIHKTCDGRNYTDVKLIEFEPQSRVAWMPSLIIPGLGTYKQGYKNSVAAKAVPFFLFAAASVIGFMYEAGPGKSIERTTIETGKFSRIWEYKNFGYYVGTGGAAIAGTIYVTDLVQSIVANVRNIRRSKQLREELDAGPIIMKQEDIILEQ